MLAADAEADEPCRNAPQDGKALEQAKRERHFGQHCLAQHERRQHTVVDRLLRPLDNLVREFPALLNPLQQRIDIFTVCERAS
jgi:hypothetical protein